MRSLLIALVLLAAAAWWLSRPLTMGSDALGSHTPNIAAGEKQFWAGGCASCHATPQNGRRAKGEAKLLLGGGLEFDTPYGIFRAPNISPHPADGIGDWSLLDFVNAMQRGVSPSGKHYYPAFPYTSYAKMPIEDVIDLKAYLDTLPPISGRSASHELGFPWNIRRGIGVWKRRYVSDESVIKETGTERGRQLVEGAGHCAECHTPRDSFGGLLTEQWLAGAPNAEGKGRIPNITPGSKSLSSWSADDLVFYFEAGLTPDYDTVGGSMVAVQENLAKLEPADRIAIADYLKGLPAIE